MNDLFANIFELWGGLYFGLFSDSLFDLNMYSWIGLSSLIITLISFLCYYYFFDSPKFIKWYHWLIVGLTNSLIIAVGVFLYVKNAFDYEGLVYAFHEYLNFALVIFFFNVFIFSIYSIGLKWWSPNRRRTPF